jgi:hypothetical protein
MRKYVIPQPQRVRKIEHSFAWIDHRLLRHGYLEVMTHHDQALYLFLTLVADRHGVSFYRKEKICDCLGLDWGEFEVARRRLVDCALIAFEPYHASNPNGYYQVLPVDHRPPSSGAQVGYAGTPEPGADPIKAVSLYGETDPIEAFRLPEQLVAFAGLDPTVFQTGEYEGSRHGISKRGCPFLRRTLWGMALGTLQRDGELRDYWLRKRREGVHHLTAVTAIAAKLCRAAWRILTDRRDYLPQRPTANS